MKVELTARDIELMIALLAQSASDDMFFNPSQLFSIEEMALLEKLESALRKCDPKEVDILDTGSSGFCH